MPPHRVSHLAPPFDHSRVKSWRRLFDDALHHMIGRRAIWRLLWDKIVVGVVLAPAFRRGTLAGSTAESSSDEMLERLRVDDVVNECAGTARKLCARKETCRNWRK